MMFTHQYLGNRICEATFYAGYGLLRLLPRPAFLHVARPFLRVFIQVAVPRARVVRNLSAAFGQTYTDVSKKGLAKGVQEHFVKNLLDCLVQLADDEYASGTIEIHGKEYLESALRKGKGVIALGVHIGNFVLLGTRLGLDGYKLSALFRIPGDRRIKNVIAKYLPRYHLSVIPSLPKRAAVTKILEALKRNEIVYILGDNLKKGRIEALLFGQRVPSPRGPISLALRADAPVVPMYLVRNYQGRMTLVIEPEIELQRSGNLMADITDNTRLLIQYVEGLIRKYPDQWNWLTVKLWRYQRSEPKPEPALEPFLRKEPSAE